MSAYVLAGLANSLGLGEVYYRSTVSPGSAAVRAQLGWHYSEAQPDFQENTLKMVRDPGEEHLVACSDSFQKWEPLLFSGTGLRQEYKLSLSL